MKNGSEGITSLADIPDWFKQDQEILEREELEKAYEKGDIDLGEEREPTLEDLLNNIYWDKEENGSSVAKIKGLLGLDEETSRELDAYWNEYPGGIPLEEANPGLYNYLSKLEETRTEALQYETEIAEGEREAEKELTQGRAIGAIDQTGDWKIKQGWRGGVKPRPHDKTHNRSHRDAARDDSYVADVQNMKGKAHAQYLKTSQKETLTGDEGLLEEQYNSEAELYGKNERELMPRLHQILRDEASKWGKSEDMTVLQAWLLEEVDGEPRYWGFGEEISPWEIMEWWNQTQGEIPLGEWAVERSTKLVEELTQTGNIFQQALDERKRQDQSDLKKAQEDIKQTSFSIGGADNTRRR